MEEKSRLVSIPFFSTVAASSNKTLVSKRITSAFRTHRVWTSFAPGTNRLLKLYFFISYDDSAPTTEQPKGTNILQTLGYTEYIVGEDEAKWFDLEVPQETRGAYLKVYAVNEDTYGHTIDAIVTIEIIEEEEEEV